jgi:predicted CXXCH cytochrome family protein
MNHSGLTDCTVCHNGSFVFANALAKAADHIPTSRNCDFCHTNFTAFAPAQMNHTLDSASKCATCHNGNFTGSNAQTKTANHVSTTAQCDTCHLSTATWATVTYMHASGDTACSTCHTAGGSGLSKQAGHIPTSLQCSVCHTNPIGKSGGYSFAYAGASLMDHTGATDCAACHNGSYLSQGVTGALAKPATHLLTSAQCSTCHTNTSNYTTWAGVTYNHTGVVAGTCANCHNGAQATGKSNLHIPTSVACDTCHTNFTAFIPATMNHASAGYGLNTHTCSSCHNGGFTGANAQAKSANHVATVAECDTCHTSLTSWATVTYDHAANGISIGGHTCANAGCHTSGGSGLPMPTTHIAPPSGSFCDSCHTNFTAFRPAVMNHTGVTTCTSCHNGSFVSQGTTGALAKHSGHIPTTADCASCHTGYVTFQNGLSAANHAAMTGPVATGNCSTCHSGAYSMSTGTVPGKTAGHIPTSRQCDACHTSTAANGFVTPAPTTANIHVGVAGLCSNCHNGGYSVTSGNLYGKHAQHEVTSAQCDTCHTNTMSYTTWTGAGHTHTAADQNLCGVSCHTGNTGQAGTAKPTTGHIPTTATCGNCHNTTTFNPATMSHTNTAGPLATVGAHTCSQCHSGTYVAQGALAKTTGHVTTTAECDTCHLTTTTWATVSYTHASTDTVCDSCHKSGGSGLSKPSSHIPTTAQCSTCHTNPIGKTAGSYSFGYSSTSLMNHTGATACSTCHNGSYTSQGILGALAKPSGTSHIPTTAQCSQCHKSFTTFAKSGGGMTMDHTGLTDCKSCHISTYVAQGLQTNPSDPVHTGGGVTASSVQCSVCHTNTLSYTTWSGGLYHKGATTTAASGTCTVCHNGTVSGADDDPSNHSLINTGLLNGSTFRNTCNNCHTIVTSWTVSKMGATGHNNSLGNGSGSCKVCHNTGATFPGSLQKKTQGNHEGSNASGDCSMSGCHKPLGNKGTSYSKWD